METNARLLYSYLIWVILIIQCLTASNKSWAYVVPQLDSDEAKLRWLISIHEHAPGLFSDAAEYDIDLMELLSHQNDLQNRLMSDPKYQKFMDQFHPNWISLTISAKSSETKKGIRIKPEAITEWKVELEKTIDLLPKDKSHALSLPKEIAAVAKELGQQTSSGMEIGLSGLLPSEKRAFFFKAGTEEKFKILEAFLPETMGSSFTSSFYGLPEKATKKEVLSRWEKIRVLENRLNALSELHVVLQDAQGNLPENGRIDINGLKAQDLDFFSDPDAIKVRMARLYLAPKRSKDLTKFIGNNVQRYSKQVETVEEKLSGRMKLIEMHPGAGIFRGCTGGDCSTQYSFPYPNAPTERVFYVYDDHGGIKGYVTGHLVEVDRKPSFRIITISGPRLSTTDTDMILEGFHKILPKLQAEQLLLPNEKNLKGFINFTNIRSSFESNIKGGKVVKVEYLDKEFRKTIENFDSSYNSADYDRTENNKTAVIYKSTNSPNLAIEVTHFDSEFKSLTPEQVKQKALLLVLDLKRSGRDSQIGRILNAAFSPKEQSVLDTVLNSSSKMRAADFEKTVKNLWGFDDSAFRKNYKHFLHLLVKTQGPIPLFKDPDFISFLLKDLAKDPDLYTRILNVDLLQELIEKADNSSLAHIGLHLVEVDHDSSKIMRAVQRTLQSLLEKGDADVAAHLLNASPNSLKPVICSISKKFSQEALGKEGSL